MVTNGTLPRPYQGANPSGRFDPFPTSWLILCMPAPPADTSHLVAFSAIDRLDVLRGIFPEVTVPLAVMAELEAGEWKEAEAVLREIRLNTWMRIGPVCAEAFPVAPPARLGAGEIETLRLAFSWKLNALVDDREARRFAARIGVKVVGSLGVLVKAKALGLISAVRPLVEGMLDHGIRLNSELVSHVLSGEG